MSTSTGAKTTALYDQHVALGGRIVEFAGALLPVQYKSIIAETKAVRERAGMFDVSHMARLKFTGERTLEYLEWVTSNDVSKLDDHSGQYSLLPNENGGCVDDIIVYRFNENEFHMVVNAANHGKDVSHLKAQNHFDVNIGDYTDATSMIAVQGPEVEKILASLADNPNEILSTPMFGVVFGEFRGQKLMMARSGYTGEDGFEMVCPNEFAPELWQMLHEAGVEPCGLGSRDTLRVEAGLPLYGHELNDERSPIEAGLGWVVSKVKPFLGSDHINQVRTDGPNVKLQGIKFDGKRFPTPDMEVVVNGLLAGAVSSGVYSPTLDCGIAFAFVDSGIGHGTACEVDIRGTMVPGTIVNKRFVKRS